MINILLRIAMVLTGSIMYIKGETDTKWLGKSNKQFKYWMGVPISLLGCVVLRSFWPLLSIPTYWLACNSGYGENNWITKLIGKANAITLHGTLVGLASYPIIGVWCVLASAISGLAFSIIYKLDEEGKIKEPKVAILRGLAGTIMLLKG